MKFLSLDMSTAATGFSVFKDGNLLEYGVIKPDKIKGITKLTYPEKPLAKQLAMAEALVRLVFDVNPDLLVIEEIAGSKNRISQKTLDGVHWIFLLKLRAIYPLNKIYYYDVSGVRGWRKHLNLRLSDADKAHNKEARKLNKKLASSQKIHIIGWKHLACAHANRVYNLDLDCEIRVTDGDIADSVSMGDAFWKVIYKDLK